MRRSNNARHRAAAITPTGMSCRLAGWKARPVGAIRTKRGDGLAVVRVECIFIREDEDKPARTSRRETAGSTSWTTCAGKAS